MVRSRQKRLHEHQDPGAWVAVRVTGYTVPGSGVVQVEPRMRSCAQWQGEGEFGVGGSKAYPYGSTTAVRGHVLAALGVLKLAIADQMHRLISPGHKDDKGFRNAALDLARHGLAASEGSGRGGHKIWHLTPVGLDVAAEVLGRPVGEMGGAFGRAACDGGERDGHRDHPCTCRGDPQMRVDDVGFDAVERVLKQQTAPVDALPGDHAPARSGQGRTRNGGVGREPDDLPGSRRTASVSPSSAARSTPRRVPGRAPAR
ncbi:hypothetical protein [Streptomyces sp. NPDC048508]|uniref:hypothetical protein n=1 Tax=Streptomyces sp. NPDC048508 TaxID=3365561 RepID=UPI0037103B76